MIRIQMPEYELEIPPLVTVGNRTRYSTSTAVAFITETLLVSAAFNNKKLYLIELLEDGSHQILQEVDTFHCPDLMKYKDGVLLTSDFPHNEPHGHASIYDLVDGKIVFRKEIKYERNRVHGCAIVDKSNFIITSNPSNKNTDIGIMFTNVETEKKKLYTNMIPYAKDVALTENIIAVVCAKSLPALGKEVVVQESILYIFDRNTMEKIDEITFQGQTDSLAINGKNIFITVQSDDCLVHIDLIDDKLHFVKRIPGFSFPHGISSINNKVAITNYGDNSIRIFELEELL